MFRSADGTLAIAKNSMPNFVYTLPSAGVASATDKKLLTNIMMLFKPLHFYYYLTYKKTDA